MSIKLVNFKFYFITSDNESIVAAYKVCIVTPVEA
jgi:hypothetical protein